MTSALKLPVTIARNVWWYMGELVGDHDYEKYVAHMQANHPGCEIPSKKQFWRDRYRDQEANPGTRCC